MFQVTMQLAKLRVLSFLPWNTFTVLLALVTMMPIVACADRREEVTHLKPYSEMVGTKYRIAGNVAAYGIYRYPQRDKILYAAIIPEPGIAGPEVAYRVQIPVGAILSIQKAIKSSALLSSTIEYSVAVTSAQISKDVELRLELSRGNEGDGLSLNPKLYERVN
ncbi:hypothetical protein [Candidatus Nitrotoga sp. AM1P]|uniref:hypothetical protein n=1 Tax=Candidatus Nitrotoga sp. AM1P TaxID=2559597 RepID=UPI0010B14481|nr:hypothetical protein [Candidatus Nitrotoga sp. AM1P]BBJ24122.1 hypothetical protein W01_20490 [Candidatus Nitrotoga sp. AM1P]